ncbi:MAG: hypothetical protein HQL46_12595 [Gammaproteobacteria bacterium]|nr:hypothetical protein [Gammaproteobacteria bacterium]
MDKIPTYDRNISWLHKHTDNELDVLERIEREAIANFSGDLTDLETALGVLRLGIQLGWKPLVLIHNKRTIRKYENILNINFKEFFKEEGPSCDRSYGYVMAKKIGNFWKAVSGDIKISNKKIIEN